MEQSTFQKLVDQLMQLLSAYEQLLSIAQEKKVSIIHNKIEEVNVATKKESRLVQPISELESTIRGYMTAIQRELGLRPKLKLTLSDLIKIFTKPDEKLVLLDVKNKLATVAVELQHANELNQQLIQQSLEYVNFSLDVLCGPEEEEVTYQRPTYQQQPKKRTGLYDAKY